MAEMSEIPEEMPSIIGKENSPIATHKDAKTTNGAREPPLSGLGSEAPSDLGLPRNMNPYILA